MYQEPFLSKRYTVIGMLHLAGEDPVSQALEEAEIFETAGVDACIVENYHNSSEIVEQVTALLSEQYFKMHIGINILPNEYRDAFRIASEYGASFIQLDHVAGEYEQAKIDVTDFMCVRNAHPKISVLGGVWPKYYTPIDNSEQSLEQALADAKTRADAIVCTGQGTGQDTPLDKIIRFSQSRNDTPIIVGAGVTPRSLADHFPYAQGCIVGSYFKDGDTRKKVSAQKVHTLMGRVRVLQRTMK